MILISHDVPHVFEVADRIAFSASAAELSWPHQRRAPTAVGITTGALPGIKRRLPPTRVALLISGTDSN
jgi:hypothetical protein